MRIVLRVVVPFLAVAFAPFLRADVSWTGIGPSGHPVKTLVVGHHAQQPPSIVLYAGAFTDGIFRSDDQGATWSVANAGLTNLTISALAILEYRGPAPMGCPPFCDLTTVLFAGTDQGLFRSADEGANWSDVGLPDGPWGITALTVTPSAVYAVGSKEVQSSRLFKSADHGISWVATGAGLSTTSVFSIAFDPTAPDTLYAGTGYNVYKSTDGGTTWTEIGPLPSVPSPPGFPTLFSVSMVAVDGNSPSTIYASGTVNEGLLPPVPGVYRSRDGGATWSSQSGSIGFVSDIVFASPSTVYAGTFGSGVFQSVDGGDAWIPVNTGLTDPNVRRLALDLQSSTVYAATDAGVFRSFGTCLAGTTSACLGGARFRVDVSWTASNISQSGVGQSIGLTLDTGAFWFFQPSNIELVIKVLDGRAINGHFWVFYGALTNVGYTITVIDTVTGATRTYTNPEGQVASRADTGAF